MTLSHAVALVTGEPRTGTGPSLELDPVLPGGAAFGVPDAVEDAAAPLDRLHRGDVVDRADDQHPIKADRPGLVEHADDRPAGQPASPRGRPDAVTDVTCPPHVVTVAVP